MPRKLGSSDHDISAVRTSALNQLKAFHAHADIKRGEAEQNRNKADEFKYHALCADIASFIERLEDYVKSDMDDKTINLLCTELIQEQTSHTAPEFQNLKNIYTNLFDAFSLSPKEFKATATFGKEKNVRRLPPTLFNKNMKGTPPTSDDEDDPDLGLSSIGNHDL